MPELTLHQIGPNASLQDLGREGYLRFGLSRGGAMDRIALLEAAALLGQGLDICAVELPSAPVRLSVSAPQRVALTGAPMLAEVDGRALQWGASHSLEAGEILSVRPTGWGLYGYIAFGGEIETDFALGRRSTHFTGGLGQALVSGTVLPLGADAKADAPPRRLKPDARFDGGRLRFVTGPQTGLYSEEMLAAFEATRFRKSGHANRQAAKLEHDGVPFSAEGQLGIVSEVIVLGDIQMTGQGEPFVLLAEHQTMGGYPRIGAVIPQDIARIAQANAGAELWFERISLEEADGLYLTEKELLRRIRDASEPLVRDPYDMNDLLGYQLISGMITGQED